MVDSVPENRVSSIEDLGEQSLRRIKLSPKKFPIHGMIFWVFFVVIRDMHDRQNLLCFVFPWFVGHMH